jgi:hypothetical protein
MWKKAVLPCLLLALVLVVACSGDGPIQQPPASDHLLAGAVDPAAGSFAVVLETAGTPDRPLQGPFVLRGTGLRYVPEAGALAVDLTITNAGDYPHPMPVGLTFMELLPDSATVLDPDNGVFGPGAAIVFDFANDDLEWTPGETSLPRTVHFGVGPGEAVAFLARVDIGAGSLMGAIGGLVWHDANGDGVADPGEPGLPQMTVVLELPGPTTAGADDPPPPDVLTTQTDADGRYRFAGLPAGFYTVQAFATGGGQPTTGAPLHVLLSEIDGAVSVFEDADFGFWRFNFRPVELEAVADATVRADVGARANDNYGCAPYLAVGRGRAGEPDLIRGLVQFEVPGAHEWALPRQALLVLQIDRYRDGVGQVYELGLHPVLDSGERTPWPEGNGSDLPDGSSCMWVDEAEGVAWVGAGDGGDANNTTQPDATAEPVAVATVAQMGMGPSALVTWDITPLVHAWMRGEAPNHGLFLRDLAPEPSDFRSLWFVSREGEDPASGRRGPRLVMVYADDPVAD